MPFAGSLSIEGLQKAQQRNLKRIAMLEPSGTLGRAVQWGIGEMHRHLTDSTPHDTGSLKATRRAYYKEEGDTARGYIVDDRNSYNPRSKTPPHVYDIYLHERGFRPGLRGGIQASYTWTRLKYGQTVSRRMLHAVRVELRGL